MNVKSFSFLFVFSAIALLSLFSSCRPDPLDGDPVVVAKDEFNAQDQKKIGDKLNDVISDPANGFEMLDPAEYPELYTHLNTMMDMIANTEYVTRRTDFDWKVSVLKDDNMETAFMTPGGHLYVYTGFLKYIDGEHELVGAMAHEVGYADNDNLVIRIKNEFGSKSLSKILSEINDSDQIAIDMANQLKDMVFSDDEVKEADEFCMNVICEFGWDATGLPHLVARGETDSPQMEWVVRKPVYPGRHENLIDLIGDGSYRCGAPNVTYQERYIEKIVSRLP